MYVCAHGTVRLCMYGMHVCVCIFGKMYAMFVCVHDMDGRLRYGSLYVRGVCMLCYVA